VWEDDQYRYIQTRSEHDLELARRYNAAADQENATAANALQAAVNNTQGTAAGFYYQAIQALRRKDTAAGAAAMEQAVKLAPDNVEYRDYLSYFYGKMGWRLETEFFKQRSIADNLGETTASKMLRLAYKQLRRQEYADARLSIAEAMRIDPADPRGPAYMGLLIAGESHEQGKASEVVSWLMAACALEDANLRLWGVRHLTPNMQYTPDQIGLESGLVVETGRRLIAQGRSPEALQLARLALADISRVEKSRWPYRVPTAMLPLVSLQGTPAPHMDPVKAAPVQNTTSWAADLHELAGNALQAMGQAAQASQEIRAAEDLRRPMQNPAGNRPAPVRRYAFSLSPVTRRRGLG